MSAPYKNDTIIKWLSTYFPRRHEWVHTNVNSVLAESVGIGGTNLAINAIPLWVRDSGGYAVLNAGNINAMLRWVPSASIIGTQATVAALEYALAVDNPVLWLPEPKVVPDFFGGICDSGTTDNLTALLRMDAQARGNGGYCWIPKVGSNYYQISSCWDIYSGSIIKGDGWIHNAAPTNYLLKTTLRAGDMGGYADIATWYDIETLTAGDSKVTFKTNAEADNCTVGDVVVIESFTLSSSQPSPPESGQLSLFTEVAEVLEVGDGYITLRNAALFTYTSANPDYSRITILSNVVKDVLVDGLTLTQTIIPGGGSFGWGFHASGLRIKARHLRMPGVCKGFGGNAIGYSEFYDIEGLFQVHGGDVAYAHTRNLFENIKMSRYASDDEDDTYYSADWGLAVHEPGGGDVIRRAIIDLKGHGSQGVTAFQSHYMTIEDCDLSNMEDNGIYQPLLDCVGLTCINNLIQGHKKFGIFVGGENTLLVGNRIGPTLTGYYGIRLAVGTGKYLAALNILGGPTQADRTARDAIYDPDNGVNGTVFGNIQYADAASERSPFAQSDLITVSGDVSGDLFRVTIPANSILDNQGWHIIASGSRTGTNAAKEVQLYVGGDLLIQIDYLAATTTYWRIEAEIIFDKEDGRYAYSVIGYLGATISDAVGLGRNLQNFSANVDIAIIGTCHNAGDTISVYTVVGQLIG